MGRHLLYGTTIIFTNLPDKPSFISNIASYIRTFTQCVFIKTFFSVSDIYKCSHSTFISADLIVIAIFSVEYVVTSNFNAVPGNCQLGASLPAFAVLVLFATLYPGSCNTLSSSSFIVVRIIIVLISPRMSMPEYTTQVLTPPRIFFMYSYLLQEVGVLLNRNRHHHHRRRRQSADIACSI